MENETWKAWYDQSKQFSILVGDWVSDAASVSIIQHPTLLSLLLCIPTGHRSTPVFVLCGAVFHFCVKLWICCKPYNVAQIFSTFSGFWHWTQAPEKDAYYSREGESPYGREKVCWCRLPLLHQWIYHSLHQEGRKIYKGDSKVFFNEIAIRVVTSCNKSIIRMEAALTL